jgi:hypothetical protein
MKKTLITFLIVVFMFACGQKQSNESSIDKTFESFLSKFNNDSIFQINRIKFPLPIIETESENFTEVHSKIERENYRKIDLTFDKADQKREGYTQNVKLSKNKATIEIRGIENGIMADYYFEKENGKWTLVGWNDSST